MVIEQFIDSARAVDCWAIDNLIAKDSKVIKGGSVEALKAREIKLEKLYISLSSFSFVILFNP